MPFMKIKEVRRCSDVEHTLLDSVKDYIPLAIVTTKYYLIAGGTAAIAMLLYVSVFSQIRLLFSGPNIWENWRKSYLETQKHDFQ